MPNYYNRSLATIFRVERAIARAKRLPRMHAKVRPFTPQDWGSLSVGWYVPAVRTKEKA